MKRNRPSAFKMTGVQEIMIYLTRVYNKIQVSGGLLKLGLLKFGLAVLTCLLSLLTLAHEKM